MAYSTDQDIFDRLGEQRVQQLTDDSGTGAVDNERLASVRDEVSRRIDLTLRGRHEVPVTDAEAVKVLSGIEVDLLAERLYQRRPQIDTPESVVSAATQARQTLTDIQRGHASLGIDADADGEEDRPTGLRVRDPKNTLKDKLRNY